MTRPSIQCPACEGEGHRPISDENFETLQALSKMGKGTVRDVFEKLGGVNLVAVHRRMERLLEAGLVRKVNKEQPVVFEVV